MKSFKKILAILLALALIVAMSAIAFADGEVTASGTLLCEGETTLTLKKAIDITHYGDGASYEPEITYTYELTVGDADGIIKEGIEDAMIAPTTVSAEFDSDTEGDGKVEKELEWSFDLSKFPSAGVYHYVIEETTDVDPADIGIVRDADYRTVKDLLVYVVNGTSGLEIMGYALYEDITQDAENKIIDWTDDEDLETYATYDLKITKNITGDGADLTAEFPFTVELTGEMGHANVRVSDNATNADGTVTADLGNGGYMYIYGLPTTVTFTVAEENPTPDTYEVTVETNTGTAVGGDLEGGDDLTVVVDGEVSGEEQLEVTVTNNLDAPSPTGVAMRIAPFMAIGGAGIVFLALSKKSKKEEE